MWRFVRLFSALTVLATLIGFIIFLVGLPKTRAVDAMPRADAIVVLTGGGGTRIRAAAALLAKNRGQRLLISGVHSTVQRDEIQTLFHLDERTMSCCIDLGYRARDTLGNADETAAWADAHNYHRLILVTSAWHMPRALIELRASLPDTDIVPFPVKASNHRGAEKWRRILVEYLKYVVILAREALLDLGTKGDE